MNNLPTNQRLVSLDQFRGYTVAGMFLVNFVGSFVFVREYLPILRHWHTYCSYADTIMPQFFFAVGFAYRLTFLRRVDREGHQSAYSHTIKRNLALLLVAFIVYHLDGNFPTWEKLQDPGLAAILGQAFQRNLFQTLTHIAITSLWILPVIDKSVSKRLAMAIISGIIFYIASESGYYHWVMKRPGIDGGPLGFLTWTIPMIAGTFAFDLLAFAQQKALRWLFIYSIAIMLAGYGLSCINLISSPNLEKHPAGIGSYLLAPPFFAPSLPVNLWTMSQRAGSVSYLVFGAGFSMFVFAWFHLLCDRKKWLNFTFFNTLGVNALAAYILHGLVEDAITPFTPKDSPWWYVGGALVLFFTINYALLRGMEKQKLFLKL